jgi:HEAT repeat protein
MAMLITNQNRVPAMKPAGPTIVTPAVITETRTSARAGLALRKTRDRSSIVGLIGRLRDADADAATEAAGTLGSLPSDAEAVDALIAAVRNFDGYFHAVVRVAAARSLARLGEVRAADALIAATRDTSAEVSEAAATALGVLGERRALPALDAMVANRSGFFLARVCHAARAAAAMIRATA